MARLGVGGAAVGRKALFFQIGQLAVQNFRLLRQIFGAVGLLLQLQVVGLQAAQSIGQTLLLGRQGVAQLVGGQFGGGLAGVAVSAASENPSTFRCKAVCSSLAWAAASPAVRLAAAVLRRWAVSSFSRSSSCFSVI